MNTFQGHEVRELFDPIQSHAVYGVNPSNVAQVKSALKEQFNATRFRVVSTQSGNKIVCFKLKK